MDKNALDKVCQKIYKQFPPFVNKLPKVLKQSDNRFLLVFSAADQTPNGKSIQLTVRVVADQNGRILKTSMQR